MMQNFLSCMNAHFKSWNYEMTDTKYSTNIMLLLHTQNESRICSGITHDVFYSCDFINETNNQ